MPKSFCKYAVGWHHVLATILDQYGNCQVIIVENELPNDVDFFTANLIEFTKNGSVGRYGFLLDWQIRQ